MNTRDLGLNHSPGKGDKPRTKFDANWAARFRKIAGMGNPPTESEGFVRKGIRFTKKFN